MQAFTESVVEEAALDWLRALGYTVLSGEDAAPGEGALWRASYADAILEGALSSALARLNPGLPADALEDARRKLTQPQGADLIQRNRALHRLLVDGVTVEYRDRDDGIRGSQARVIDYDDPDNNDWTAFNQFTVVENKHVRRPDIVLFVNGLPVAVLELKNAAAESATVDSALRQLATYQAEIPALFATNAVLIASDGVDARIGVLGAGREWFKPWRTVRGDELAPVFMPQLQVVVEGALQRRRFLDLLRDFIVFEDDGSGRLVKKMAGYHQFHAVQVAVGETMRAAELLRAAGQVAEPEGRYEAGRKPGGQPGDRRVGVVWHTQGSGKSLTMAFYAGRIIREPMMENPTVVVLTDRNDLDDQLFGTFSRCQDLLRQPPVQAESRAHLRELLSVAAGGVVFTTIHKFFPPSSEEGSKGDRHPTLSDRRNIVVIADEAHRSQYDFVDGFARHMRDALPHASFIGFTGTPIELQDANTRAVFGDYISVYDIQRAVQDGATVPIYYESRLARLALDAAERPKIDPEFEEATEGEEVERKEKLKTKWAQLEAVVGAEKRLALVAKDIVEHFEKRLEAMDGKAMIVCMSRRICVELYREIVKLRPEWAGDEDEHGALKVVMTGSASDSVDWQQHIRNKPRREALANRFRDPKDPFRLVIVRDMWLTGFDAPSLHTMYIDKPMRGHGLMQAIARVNRVFRDKPGGLVVDYLGLAHELKQALATYTESGGTGRTALDQDEAVAVMLEKYEVCCGLFHGFDWSKWTTGHAAGAAAVCCPRHRSTSWPRRAARTVACEPSASCHRPSRWPYRTRRRCGSATMSPSFRPCRRCSPSARPATRGPRRSWITRSARSSRERSRRKAWSTSSPRPASRSPTSRSSRTSSWPRCAGCRSGISPWSCCRSCSRVRQDHARRKNVVQARSFAEMLEQTVRRYQNRAIEAAQVIEELIQLAKDMREAGARGERLALSEDELAFYDALETNDSAVKVLGEPTLRAIAQELVRTVRANVTIDWTLRENVRAQLRVYVKRILRKYGYPPDKQEKATRTVLEQAELLSEDWAAA